MTADSTPPSRLPPDSLEHWRSQVTTTAIRVAAAVGVFMALGAIWMSPDLHARIAFGGSAAAVVGLAALPRLDHRVRAGAMAVLTAVLAAVSLEKAGLSGAGRLVLFVAPLFTLVLVGLRAGLLNLALSLAIYAGFAAFVAGGWMPPSTGQESLSRWLYQGFFLALVSIPLFVLIDRAVAFQGRSLERQRALAQDLAREVANRQGLERRILEVAEGERNAVGQDLHDGVCQQLSAAYLGARLLERSLAGSGADAARAGELADLVDSALQDARLLARGLNPGPLPDGGLPDALRELARQVRDRVEVDCDFVGGEAPSLPSLAATQLLRVAQEATANAIRHSSANRITIDLVEAPGSIRLVVRDDGRGIGEDAAPGMGLRSMANRAQALGGSLAVTPLEGGGTEVACTLPRPEGGGQA